MAFTASQIVHPRTRLQEGATYRDRSNNLIRLLTIGADYCAYVYVSPANLPCSMHGPVTGVTRRDVFETDFLFAADTVNDGSGDQRRRPDRTEVLHVSVPADRGFRRLELRSWPVSFGGTSRSAYREPIRRA